MSLIFMSLAICAAFAQSPEDSVRIALQRIYSRIDAAYAQGDADAVASLALPDATVSMGDTRQPLTEVLTQVMETLRKGTKLSSKTTVDSVSLDGDLAYAIVTSVSTMTAATGAQSIESKSRDTWVKTAAGWRMKDSTLVAMHATAPPTGPEEARAVTAELKQRAAPLDSLDTFGKAVGDARIVALGEATHGGSEFFRIKQRLVQYLVEQKGFTVIALEANWPEVLAIDRYIKTGEGDPKAALRGVYFWAWNSQELLDLVEWMRAYNRAAGNRPLLTFTGYDMHTPKVAADTALEYLRRVSPEDAGQAQLVYTQENASKASDVLRVFDANREAWSRATSAAKWLEARQAAAIAYQAYTFKLPEKGAAYRDLSMAGNVEWLAAQQYPREKIVLWGHNTHLGFGGQPPDKSMGTWLRERYGLQMYVAGFAFRGGRLRAVGVKDGRNTELGVQTAEPSPEGSGDAVLSGAGLAEFFLDLRTVPNTSALGKWLAAPHLFRGAGSVWITDDPKANFRAQALSKAFDGVFFVEETHATIGLQ